MNTSQPEPPRLASRSPSPSPPPSRSCRSPGALPPQAPFRLPNVPSSLSRLGCRLGFALFLLPLASSPAADWPTHRADSGRTGLGSASLRFPLEPAWIQSLQPPKPAWGPPARRSYWQRLEQLAARVADDHVSAPALAEGALVCGSSADDHVRCFDLDSGGLRWIVGSDGPVRYAPTIDSGRVFFGSDDGWIYAVRMADGVILWRHRPSPEDRRIPGNDRLISVWPIRSGLVVDRGTVFATAGLFPHQGTFAVALNATDGSLQWKQPLDVSPEGYLLATDRLVVIPTGRASPIGLDRDTGNVVRAFDTGGGTYAVASEGELFGGPGNQGTLSSLAAPTGQRLLSVPGRNLVADATRLHLLENGRLRTIDRGRQNAARRRLRDLESQVRSIQSGNAKPVSESSTPRLEELSGALAQARRDLESCELWSVSTSDDLTLIGLRESLVTGGTNRVSVFDRAAGDRLWEAPVLGHALALAASDGFLAVATSLGSLHVYRAPRESPRRTAGSDRPPAPGVPPPASLPTPASEPSSRSVRSAQRRRVAEASPAMTGYALVLGLGSDHLVDALLATTGLRIVAIDTDATRVEEFRARFRAGGQYGTRVSAHVVPPGPLPFTDYFANLVISEGSPERSEVLPWPATECERVTRPFGGVRWIHPDPIPVRRGPPEGAGSWTHQFGNPANTANSGDRLVHADLALQWFGGPGPDLMVDRHLRGPAPLAAAGRLFVPGENRLVALDAYNGTELWNRELPGSQRYTMPYDAGYLSVSGDRLAVAVRDACWLLDAADGRRVQEWRVPVLEGVPSPVHWGYTVLLGGHVVGSAQHATASRTKPGYEQIDVDYNNDQPLVTGLALFRMDAATGRTIWKRQGTVILNTSLALSDGRLYAVESRDPELLHHPTGRIPLSRLLEREAWIVALDANTGRVLWESPVRDPSRRSRSVLYSVAAGDRLVLVGSHLDPENDTRYSVEVRSASDGTVSWTSSHLARVPGEFTHGEQVHHPVLLDDLLVAEPAAYDLASGKRLSEAGGSMPWNLVRPGHSCGTLSGTGDCLFFRAGNPTVMDLRANLRSRQPPAKISPSRTGCWINMIPANGLLLIPEASAGCVCQFSLQTSMAFIPRPR